MTTSKAHASEQHHTHGASSQHPAEFWENRYADADRVWSGKVNRTLQTAVEQLSVGRSLDLGCGEGGDVLWLAEHGWDALGIDLSTTATARGRAEAAARGLATARFVAADLGEWAERPEALDGAPDGFDLVTASFFQSPVELPRERIIRKALERLTVGGSLVLLSHAAAPGWAKGHGGPKDFYRPEDELATLELSEGETMARANDTAFEVVEASIVLRNAVGPDGHEHELEDSLVIVRRVA